MGDATVVGAAPKDLDRANPNAQGDARDKSVLPERLGRFVVRWERCLGKGSYWSVYAGWDPRTGEQCAIKVQSGRIRPEGMLSEAAFLRRLEGLRGIPALLDWGVESGVRFLALQRLGSNTQQLADSCGGLVDRRTALRWAVQLVRLLAGIHRRGVLHRDVKPENLLVGPHYSRTRDDLFLVDFGFAKQFDARRRVGSKRVEPIASLETRPVAIKPTGRKRFVGTPLFASLAAHEGVEILEKDDLESAVYTLVHLYFGRLPWTSELDDSPVEPGVGGPWFPAIAAAKRRCEAADLVSGNGWLPPDHPKMARPMPTCFATALRYAQCLVVPGTRLDHAYLVDLFESELERLDANGRFYENAVVGSARNVDRAISQKRTRFDR